MEISEFLFDVIMVKISGVWLLIDLKDLIKMVGVLLSVEYDYGGSGEQSYMTNYELWKVSFKSRTYGDILGR